MDSVNAIRKGESMGLGLLILAQFMVGVGIVGSKILVLTLSPVTILLFRFFLGAALMFGLHLLVEGKTQQHTRSITRKQWLQIVAQAMCAGMLFNLLLLTGLHYTGAAVAGIVTSALPAVVVVFSILFLNESLSLSMGLCVLLAVVGLLIINYHPGGDTATAHYWLGYVFLLASLIPEALYYVLVKRYQCQLPVFLLSSIMLIVNVPILLVMLLFSGSHIQWQALWHGGPWLLMISASSAMFYVCWFVGSRYVAASRSGLTTAFMPISTLIIAHLVMHEKVSHFQVAGMLLVLFSIGLSVIRKRTLSC